MAATIKKPQVSAEDALSFATGGKPKTTPIIAKAKKAPRPTIQRMKWKPGKVPDGDVKLTANISADLHMRLKMVAVQERTTIGELCEQMIEDFLKKHHQS